MIEDLKIHIQHLISLYETERDRADALAAKLVTSEAQLEESKKQITDLKKQIDKINLTGAFTSGSDNPEAKERINKLIKEIDRCIRLLEN